MRLCINQASKSRFNIIKLMIFNLYINKLPIMKRVYPYTNMILYLRIFDQESVLIISFFKKYIASVNRLLY